MRSNGSVVPRCWAATEVPDPVAGPGQVVIEVAAADVLFVETQVRAGWGAEYFSLTPPYVPGDGVAGRVVTLGAGVDPSWGGRRVAPHAGPTGGYAERVVVGADELIPVPDDLELASAAALLTDGPTALTVFDAAGIVAGQWVLVAPATGGFSSLVVQLAHEAGARVIGAARGERKLRLAEELGADLVVDYSLPGWPDRLREATGGHGADVVFDGVGGEFGDTAFGLTADGGHFSAHGAPSGRFANADPQVAERRKVSWQGIGDVQLSPDRRRELGARAFAEAAAGRIRPVIGQTFALKNAAAAHEAIESRRTIGKTLLLP
ncbi:MAG: zinc-binding dehydrogenase [Frankia sp.]